MTIYSTSNNSASDGFAVTPSDTTVFATAPRALYVGTTGNIKLVTVGGTTLTFVGIPAGTVLPVVCTKVFATDTTASTIVGLY